MKIFCIAKRVCGPSIYGGAIPRQPAFKNQILKDVSNKYESVFFIPCPTVNFHINRGDFLFKITLMIFFIVWTVGVERLKQFLEYLSNAHDTIKFTYKWSEHEIEFLNVKVLNESGVLETDVFIKPTDSHQYLHYSSCHPGACKRSILFAQAMRLRRICSKSCFFEKRAGELVKYLMERSYRKAYVESQVDKVRWMSRAELLSKSNQPRSTKTPFVVTYHPRLPDISRILRKLHPILESSERCKNASAVFHLWRFVNQRAWGIIWYAQRWTVVDQNICY